MGLIEELNTGMQPIIAAPLAGYLDPPTASILASFGVRHEIYPFISADGIIRRKAYRSEVSGKLELWRKIDPPIELHAQIFGKDPQVMSDAASFLEKEIGVDLIDINMGCSVRKIWKSASGSLLLKEPRIALEIIEIIRAVIKIPLTIKTRTGWDSDENGLTIIEKCGNLGVNAVTLHPRKGKQQFDGHADWSKIAKAVEFSEIPVIGNGDILTPVDAKRMLDETNAKGIMIGRAYIGNPWIFPQIESFLGKGELIDLPSALDRIDTCLRHLKAIVDFKGAQAGLKESRKHVSKYLKGLPDIVEIRQKIVTCDNYDEVKAILEEYKENYAKAFF